MVIIIAKKSSKQYVFCHDGWKIVQILPRLPTANEFVIQSSLYATHILFCDSPLIETFLVVQEWWKHVYLWS